MYKNVIFSRFTALSSLLGEMPVEGGLLISALFQQ